MVRHGSEFRCVLLIDIDECSASTDNCDTNAYCLNTPGSFLCECNSGFTGNGTICEGTYTRVNF